MKMATAVSMPGKKRYGATNWLIVGIAHKCILANVYEEQGSGCATPKWSLATTTTVLPELQQLAVSATGGDGIILSG